MICMLWKHQFQEVQAGTNSIGVSIGDFVSSSLSGENFQGEKVALYIPLTYPLSVLIGMF